MPGHCKSSYEFCKVSVEEKKSIYLGDLVRFMLDLFTV